MSVRDCPEDVLVVDFPPRCDVAEELETVAQLVQGRVRRDIVVNLSTIDILNTRHIAALLQLRQSQQACGHRLVLCNVAPMLRGVFSVTGLDAVFEIARDGLEVNGWKVNQRCDTPPVNAGRPGL